MKPERITTKVQICILVTLLSSDIVVRAQKPAEIPHLILLAAHNQDQSMAVRDRTRYQQELTVQRFALAPKNKKEVVDSLETNSKKLGERKTVVSVEPSLTPDEKGRHEVLVQTVSDTDDQGQPKIKMDPKAQPGLLVEILWDELLFPLQEEKIPFLKFESLPSSDPALALFRFGPAARPRTMVLASGVIAIDTLTGGVKEIQIEALHNLQAIHKQLSKLERISARVEFTPYRQIWNLPRRATGEGISHLPHWEGFFLFTFAETGYEPVMEIPDTQTIQF